MVQVCAHLWAMQQLLFWRAFPCSQDAQLLVHKHMPRAGFLYEYGRPAGAARARVNRDSRNELKELHATQKVCHRRAACVVCGVQMLPVVRAGRALGHSPSAAELANSLPTWQCVHAVRLGTSERYGDDGACRTSCCVADGRGEPATATARSGYPAL
jgi:hypothetical protein